MQSVQLLSRRRGALTYLGDIIKSNKALQNILHGTMHTSATAENAASRDYEACWTGLSEQALTDMLVWCTFERLGV